MKRITVKLNAEAHSALWELAEREHRLPHDQAALLLEQRLRQLGVLPKVPPLAKTDRPAAIEAQHG